MRNTILLLLLFITTLINAQTLTSLGDINPGSGSSANFEDHFAIYFNDLIIFTANTGALGEEPMVYDGEESSLLLDIREGSESSEPTNYYIVNDKLIFSADDGIHGREWWTTDGTTEGTRLLLDLFVGEERGVYPGSSDPFLSFHHFGDILLFVGTDKEDNLELWKTDGTAEGTTMVKDIVPAGFFGDKPSFPESFVTFKNEVYFACRDGFWKTDGTESGTVKVKSDHPTNFFGFEPSSLFATEDFILLVDDPGIWISDGTTSGTQILKELSLGSSNSFENRFNEVGPYVLFAGSDDANGDELWKTDGTSSGTEMVIDLDPGTDGYSPQNSVIYKGEMYYKGDNGSTGIELYKTDGTANGTKLVKDIASGSSTSFFLPSYIVADDNYIYFKAKQTAGKELWYSDGTSGGTIQVDINPSGDSSPNSFYLFNNKLFLFAEAGDQGFEPYVFDALGSEPIDMDQDGFTDDVDCDDSDPEVNADQVEIPFNDKDDDCNPETLDNDADMDGYGNDVDCDDNNNLVNPGLTEITYNGIDDDCDATTLDDDLDQDGFTDDVDCDDSDPGVNTDQVEIPFNDKDDDCNPETLDNDADMDGYGNDVDCDDNNNMVNPGLTEITYNGIDDDCDELTLDDDLDGDGFVLEEDCNDLDSLINPAVAEIVGNDIDENCDGEIGTSSTLDHNTIQIGVYPNPASEHIYFINSDNHSFKVNLYSLLGSKLLSLSNPDKLDVSNIDGGTYFIEIIDLISEDKYISKVIIR